ncbi:MAG: hypothetical protein VCC01_12265 [Candidatus Hydrogenedentota bacterium]
MGLFFGAWTAEDASDARLEDLLYSVPVYIENVFFVKHFECCFAFRQGGIKCAACFGTSGGVVYLGEFLLEPGSIVSGGC